MSANWIPDVNRFGIPKPPDWFLKLLWDQDAALVMLPSRQSAKYILARRRSLSRIVAGIVANVKPKNHKRVPNSDGDMLESRQLVPVDTITSRLGNVFQASWMTSAPEILKDLRARDMWEAGGGSKYADKIAETEQAEQKRQRANMLDDLEHRAADAYRSYQARTGRRNQHANDRAVLKNRAVHA